MIFNYCPRCKGTFIKEAFNLLRCTVCGFPFYLNPKPTSSAILENEKGQILLARRKYPPKKGYWNLPGGFIDIGENAENATLRELKEELDLTLTSLHYIVSWPGSYHYKGITSPTLNMIFYGRLRSDNPLSPQDDVSEIVYFTAPTIPFDRFAFPGEAQALKEFLKAR